MTYMHRAPANRNPLSAEETARLEVLAAKKILSGWERGEMHALALRAPFEVQERLKPALASKRRLSS